MSSMSQETRTCLDNSLVLPFDSWGHLKAARSIDLKEVIAQIKVAAEAAEKLRSFVLSEQPNASWQNRQELDALLERIDKEIQIRTLRSQLLDLAAELERGTVAHRRAARVEQLNQYRNQAIKELRNKAAAKGAPPPLPGPQADQWIEWACALEEPGDAKALQSLRGSFPALEDFVSHLEPGMWQIEAVPGTTAPRTEKTRYEHVQKDLRERLRSLASELERGSVVHHRAVRVAQLNQLRDQSVKELRDQAGAKGMPSPLPGPIVTDWVEWACSLREPEDSEAVESIRDGFPHLDDFIAHLEPDMWVPGSPESSVTPAETAEKSTRSQPVAVGAAAGASASSAAASVMSMPHMQVPLLVDEDDDENSLRNWIREKKSSVSDRLQARKKPASVENASEEDKATAAGSGSSVKVTDGLKGKRAVILGGAAVVVLAALGTMGWRSHRMRAANNVVSAAAPAPSIPDNQPAAGTVLPISGQGIEVTQGSVAPKDSSNSAAAANTQAANSNSAPDKASKQKTDTPAAPDSTKKAAQLGDGQLRTPAPIPKAGKGSASTSPETAPDMLALAGSPNGNRVVADVASAPVAKPQFSGQNQKASSGVTQGLLVQSVKPVYPLQAQQAHVEGTVVLNATIGKDGSVEGVKVVSGHPMLTQAAVEAVKRWRYKPYYLNGEPVEAETEIKIKFAPQ